MRDRANILASDELLARRGVTVHEINRGGDVTYHGPGQLVGYPIFDLRTLRDPSGGRMGPVDFVRGMEEALIRLCGGFGVRAGRICGLTGVWCPADGSPLDESRSSGPGPQDRRHRDSCRARHHLARLRLQRDHRPERLCADRSLRHSPITRSPAWQKEVAEPGELAHAGRPLRTRRRGSLARSSASRCWRWRAWRRCAPRLRPLDRRNFRRKTRRSRFPPRWSGCGGQTPIRA